MKKKVIYFGERSTGIMPTLWELYNVYNETAPLELLDCKGDIFI